VAGDRAARLSVRILFASHYALPHLGGIEVAVDALAAELAGRGHEVCHVASGARRADEHGPRPTAYRVVRVPALNAAEARLGVPYPLFAPALLPALRREVARADVVHGHGLLYQSSALALWLARRARRLPVRAATEHVGHVAYASPVLDAAQRAAFATLGRATARSAQGLVVLNAKVEEEVRALAPGRPVVRIGNGVDADRYRPPARGEREALRAGLGWDDRPRVLFVGRLVAKKGLDHALAAAAAGAGAWELVVVGPGDPPASLPPAARVLGPLPPERVAALYRAADAFLLPSRGEGFPITAQEAMASGLPVVLAAEPGYAPYVGGAGTGVRLAATAPDALAAAVAAALADAEAGPRAAAHARRAFSWARSADEHEALWGRLESPDPRSALR
jgi:glycosyltransferase involved in cell wall biosynthesis